MQPLTAISPIDGRYRDKVENLANYFSESALIRYRVTVEVEYFISLCEVPLPQLAGFDHTLFEQLREIYRNFTLQDAQKIKDIEMFNTVRTDGLSIEWADGTDICPYELYNNSYRLEK